MPIYTFQGLCHSPGYAEISAENRAEAMLRARKGDFDIIHPEDDPTDFTINDSEYPEFETEEESNEPEDYEVCYSCDEPFEDKSDAVELECGKGWCHRGDCLNEHIGGCGLCPIGLGDDD